MQVDGRIERLIVRKLDGEISESEQLELDRELLRSADVRAMYESYCEVDDLAADVIKTCTRGSGEAGASPQMPVLRVRHEVVASRPKHHGWMIYASGLAACLALFLIWKTPDSTFTHLTQDSHRNADDRTHLSNAADRPQVGNGWDNGNGRLVPTNVSHANPATPDEIGIWKGVELPAQRLDRVTDQNLLVVPSENGGYYIFHVDHVQQVRQPKVQADTMLWNKPV